MRYLLAILFTCFFSLLGCSEKKDEAPLPPKDTWAGSALRIAADPTNFGYHSIGQEEGMCFGFAINLMIRLNKEADVTKAWIMVVTGIGDPEPWGPERPPNHWHPDKFTSDSGMWGHAIVLFTTPDNKIYAVDENVDGPVELDLNQLDLVSDDVDANFAEMVIRQLWSHLKSRYPVAWEQFKVSAPHFIYGKQQVFDDFADMANIYFTMQNHAYYFPLDWCLD